MNLLDRKLVRDIVALRGQVITIALVVAAGVAVFVASVSTFYSLRSACESFYAETRFPQIFVTLKRAPLSIVARLSEIPGVVAVEPRIVRDVLVDWPASNLPVSARIVSITRAGDETLARLHLRSGVAPGSHDSRDAAINEAFAEANAVKPGADVRVLLNQRMQGFHITGIALSPEYVYAVKPGLPIPDDRYYAILWVDRSAAEAAFDMKGAFNDAIVSLAPGVDPKPVIAELDRLLEPYGSVGAIEQRDQTSNRFLQDELNQQKLMAITIPFIFFGISAFLLNVVLGRMVAAQREQIATLKALGFPTARLVLHYMKLVFIIVLIGSALGVAGRLRLQQRDDRKLSRLFPPAGPRLRTHALVDICRHGDQPCGRFVRSPLDPAHPCRHASCDCHASGGTFALSSLAAGSIPAAAVADVAPNHDHSQHCRAPAPDRTDNCGHCFRLADGRARPILEGCDRSHDRAPVQPGGTRQCRGHISASARPPHRRRSGARTGCTCRRRPASRSCASARWTPDVSDVDHRAAGRERVAKAARRRPTPDRCAPRRRYLHPTACRSAWRRRSATPSASRSWRAAA